MRTRELDVQPSDLAAGVAGAEVVRDHPSLSGMKRAVHGEGSRNPLARSGPRPLFAVRSREEERVSLDLDQSQFRHSVEHRFEQALRDLLRVSEVQPMEAHELRVAADVGEKQKRPVRHAPAGVYERKVRIAMRLVAGSKLGFEGGGALPLQPRRAARTGDRVDAAPDVGRRRRGATR
jgi:hypothetical protein